MGLEVSPPGQVGGAEGVEVADHRRVGTVGPGGFAAGGEPAQTLPARIIAWTETCLNDGLLGVTGANVISAFHLEKRGLSKSRRRQTLLGLPFTMGQTLGGDWPYDRGVAVR
jgi:hypothetical protein